MDAYGKVRWGTAGGYYECLPPDEPDQCTRWGYRREAEEFRKLLETGESELCTLEQGLDVVAAVDAARRAVRSAGWEHCPKIKNSMEEHQ